MDESKEAILDASHRAYVNHEVFFFATSDEREKFVKQPERYCGIVTDPVNRERFRPNKVSPRLEHKGRPFFFISESTMAEFQADPDSFFVPNLRMMSKTGSG
jgi:YHS domain-containing protein